ncbi:MAG: hypothetical protein HXS40_00710 [Theionarchaea archaeon]|nr:hypothetical protein [Theionarchaea archaeon]
MKKILVLLLLIGILIGTSVLAVEASGDTPSDSTGPEIPTSVNVTPGGPLPCGGGGGNGGGAPG